MAPKNPFKNKAATEAKRTVVRWTAEEQAAVAARMVELSDADPTLSMLNALREAQVSAVSSDRQRTFHSIGSDKKWLEPALKAARAQASAELQARMEAARGAGQGDTPAAPEIEAPAPDTAFEDGAPLPTLREAAEDFLVDVLRGVAIRLLRDPALHQALASAIVGRPVAPPTQAGQQPAALQPTKRVVIVGLLNGQAQEIRAAFSKEINLRILGADEHARLRAALPGADAVVSMTKFVGHDVEHTVRGSGVQLVRVDGGMTKLREELRKFVRV